MKYINQQDISFIHLQFFILETYQRPRDITYRQAYYLHKSCCQQACILYHNHNNIQLEYQHISECIRHCFLRIRSRRSGLLAHPQSSDSQASCRKLSSEECTCRRRSQTQSACRILSLFVLWSNIHLSYHEYFTF